MEGATIGKSRQAATGNLAAYIPELATVDPTPIGIAAAGLSAETGA